MSRTLAPFSLTADVMKPVAAWIRNLSGRRALADMPDYLLSDIGLRRDQIDALGAWREDAAPATAAAHATARPSADVVAITPAMARPGTKPTHPEKPLAA
jgi:uncharacterized protein YjiS (DUF1127 family)